MGFTGPLDNMAYHFCWHCSMIPLESTLSSLTCAMQDKCRKCITCHCQPPTRPTNNGASASTIAIDLASELPSSSSSTSCHGHPTLQPLRNDSSFPQNRILIKYVDGFSLAIRILSQRPSAQDISRTFESESFGLGLASKSTI